MKAEGGVDGLRDALERGLAAEEAWRREAQARGAAVLIPLLPGEEGFDVLFEVRAANLKRQPGEVCFPGGHVEAGETPRQAAVREACEELLVAEGQVDVIADLGCADGPGGMPTWVFAATLRGYAGTFAPSEVGSVFTVPLTWFQRHEPQVHRVELVTRPQEDFPWELIPQGRDYPWRIRRHDTPFYLGTDPLIWGFTARMMQRFVNLLVWGGGAGS